jgi:hypothetical protein
MSESEVYTYQVFLSAPHDCAFLKATRAEEHRGKARFYLGDELVGSFYAVGWVRHSRGAEVEQPRD